MNRDPQRISPDDLRRTVGLCATCAHAVRVTSVRGSEFWQCGLSAVDSRYSKYPRLPVLECRGHLDDGVNRPSSSR